MKLEMIEKDCFVNEKNIIIYINELPFELPLTYSKTNIEINNRTANIKICDKQLCIELYKKKDHSNYALLGCKYINTNLPLQVEINIYETNENYFTSMNCIDRDKKYKGIKYEYINKIKEGVLEFFRKNNVYFLGKIVFNIGAHCEVGSSGEIFREITEDLLKLMVVNNYNVVDVKNIIYN